MEQKIQGRLPARTDDVWIAIVLEYVFVSYPHGKILVLFPTFAIFTCLACFHRIVAIHPPLPIVAAVFMCREHPQDITCFNRPWSPANGCFFFCSYFIGSYLSPLREYMLILSIRSVPYQKHVLVGSRASKSLLFQIMQLRVRTGHSCARSQDSTR